MNIFYLDHNPELCAKYHCDKHVVKMILESAQIMSTVHFLSSSSVTGLYKPTHKNHPVVKWCLESGENYWWVYLLFQALLQEYTYRYGKVHKSASLISKLALVPNIPAKPMTKPALAMPEEFKTSNPIEAYRNYYRGAKKHLLTWKYRETPKWVS